MWDDIEGAIYKTPLGYIRFELSRRRHIIALEFSPEELEQQPDVYKFALDEMTRRLDV